MPHPEPKNNILTTPKTTKTRHFQTILLFSLARLLFSTTSSFLPRENFLAGVQKAQFGILPGRANGDRLRRLSFTLLLLFISGEVLSSAFGEAKRDFYYCLSVIWNDNRKERGIGMAQIGRKGGFCEREGGTAFYLFLLFRLFFIVDLHVVILKLS